MKGGEKVHALDELLSSSNIECNGENIIYKHITDHPTIQYDPVAKYDISNVSESNDRCVVIELSNNIAVAISCTKEEELGLQWTTKQCYGFTNGCLRCANRRHTNERHAWCHHHITQKSFYDSEPVSSCRCYVPDWW